MVNPTILLFTLIVCILLCCSLVVPPVNAITTQITTITSKSNNGCPAGYYDSSNIERPCYQCDMGFYCPGDGKEYTCPSGTISSQQGAAQCSLCDTKRCNLDHTICLLPGTPQDAQEYVYGSNLVLDSKLPYYYITLYGNGYGVQPKTIQLSIVGKQPIPIEIYASYSTGQPHEGNSEFTNKGINATISVVPQDLKILYLYIVPFSVNKVIAELKLFRYLDLIEQLQPNKENYFSYTSELSMYGRNMLLFRMDNVPTGSRVNFTLNCDFWKKDWASPITYSLFYSTLPNIEYPNINNANIIVNSQRSNQPKTSNIFQLPPNSNQFIIAFYHDNTYYYAEMVATATIIH